MDIDPHKTHVRAPLVVALGALGAAGMFVAQQAFNVGHKLARIEAQLERVQEQTVRAVTKEDLQEIEARVRARLAHDMEGWKFSCHQFPMRGMWSDCSPVRP